MVVTVARLISGCRILHRYFVIRIKNLSSLGRDAVAQKPAQLFGRTNW